MGSRGITYLINCFHSCINSCIKSDGVLCTCNIQVDRAWYTDGIYTKGSQLLCSCKGTVSTDHYQSVNTMLLADLCASLLSFCCTEFCTTCCIKDRTATFNGIGYILRCHIYNLFIQQSIISLQYTFYI